MVEPYRVLSLFAGIGGIDLGLERTGGFKTVAFCEIDAKARQVLAKHWNGVPIYEDVRSLNGTTLAADGITPNAIVGGFPCQDISTAGKGAGLNGERSGLFYEAARLIGELRPEFILLENVSALLTRGLAEVLGTLAALGYDAEWHCIPASAVGAPHRRDRIWIVAYPHRQLGNERRPSDASEGAGRRNVDRGGIGAHVADTPSQRPSGQGQPFQPSNPAPPFLGETAKPINGRFASQWAVEPNVGRVANGVSGRVDRLKQLGNAVVPQIPELIGRAWLERNAA